MSARVLNPMMFTEFCKLRASPSAQQIQRNLTFQRRQINSAKRDLFGGSSSTEVKKLFDDEIKQHQETATKKWGFDFRSGQPTTSTTYSWERVVVPEIVPEMYTLTRAAHIREIISEPPTEQDILMDDRSSKENSIDEILSFPFKTPSSRQASASSTSPSKMILSCHKSLGKRQPRITEYMKERKRLSQTPKKVSPSKRQRTSSGSSTSSLSMFVTSRK
ncbi:dap family protein [Megaselia abdita]